MQIHDDDYRSKGYVASSAAGYDDDGISRGTLFGMRSTRAIDAALRARLKVAVDDFAGGSADEFGRLCGYKNGGYIRECLNNKKPVREALIFRANSSTDARLHGLFNDLLPAVALADVQSKTEPPEIKRATEWLRLLTVDELGQTIEFIKRLAFKGGDPEVTEDADAFTEEAATYLPPKKVAAKRVKRQS